MSHCDFMGVSDVKIHGKVVNLLESQDSFTVTPFFSARTSIVKYYPQLISHYLSHTASHIIFLYYCETSSNKTPEVWDKGDFTDTF